MKERLIAFLKDFEATGETGVTLVMVRRFLHGCSASALTEPLVAHLLQEGKVVSVGEGKERMIYLTERGRDGSEVS